MVKWDSNSHEQILVYANQVHKLDCHAISKHWNENNPKDKLTASAISQHLNKLRGKTGKAGNTPTKSAPYKATPVPSTPRSKGLLSQTGGSAKRKQTTAAMDDDDDEEPDADLLPIKRESPRNARKIPRKYEEWKTDSEDDDEGSSTSANNMSNPFDLSGPLKATQTKDSPFLEKLGKEKAPNHVDHIVEDDSDVSSYNPMQAFLI